MDLPIELRYNVYEYYFEDDTKSLACAEWIRGVDIHCINVEPPCYRRSAPFLPSLCHVSQAVRTEVTSLLLRTAQFKIMHYSNARYFLRKIDMCPTIPLENIPRLVLQIQDNYPMPRAPSESRDRSLETNRVYGLLLKRCVNVQNLNINFHAYYCVLDCPTCPSLCELLAFFNLPTVLNMGMLQGLRISGINTCPGGVDDSKTWLRRVAQFARKVKDGFERMDRDVKVEVCLDSGHWSEINVL
jgi:hypothetical protein